MEAEKEREQARPEEEFPLLEQAPAETPAPAEEPEIRAETLVDEIGPDKPKKKREKKPRAEKPEGSAPRSGHGWKIALLVFLVLVLAASAVVLALDGRQVQFRMVDSSDMTVPFGQPFTDPGCTAVTVGRLFGMGKYQLPVTIRGAVDTNTLGTYELEYSARFLLRSYV